MPSVAPHPKGGAKNTTTTPHTQKQEVTISRNATQSMHRRHSPWRTCSMAPTSTKGGQAPCHEIRIHPGPDRCQSSWSTWIMNRRQRNKLQLLTVLSGS